MSRDYQVPTLKITAEEAVAHRLRRVYLPLAAVLIGAWLVRVTAFSATSFPESAAVGMIPGLAVALAVALVAAGAIIVACRPRTWDAKSELRAEDLREKRP